MSMPSPTPPRRSPDRAAWRPDRRTGWWVLGAFLVGLVLFLLAIRGSRDEFFRPDAVPPTSATRAYPPLPAPLPAGEGTGIRPMAPPVEEPEEKVARVEAEARERAERRQAAREEARQREEAREARPSEAVATSQPRPIPGQTPAPDYPARALMRGEGGTALVIAHIGPDGVPTSTEIAQSSGSRELDRAAMQAVRRWRFEPAREGGRPTVGRVAVPIDFQVSR